MALLKKKKLKLKAQPMAPLTMEEQLELAPGSPVIPGTNWESVINADPMLRQSFVDIGAEGVADKSGTMAALRQALIRMGGAGLSGVAGRLGGDWSELLDPTTLAAAQSGDAAGTSISSQLLKEHTDRLLAEEDIRASRGMLDSGQSGYEIGRERQRHTISSGNAIDSLLQALQGGIGQFAGREGERNAPPRCGASGSRGQGGSLGPVPHAGDRAGPSDVCTAGRSTSAQRPAADS